MSDSQQTPVVSRCCSNSVHRLLFILCLFDAGRLLILFSKSGINFVCLLWFFSRNLRWFRKTRLLVPDPAVRLCIPIQVLHSLFSWLSVVNALQQSFLYGKKKKKENYLRYIKFFNRRPICQSLQWYGSWKIRKDLTIVAKKKKA